MVRSSRSSPSSPSSPKARGVETDPHFSKVEFEQSNTDILIDLNQDGICGTSRPQQNMGIVTVRITSYSTGCDYRQYRNCSQSAESAQRTYVSYLLGYVKKNYDHQGVSASLLLRLYYYSFTEW